MADMKEPKSHNSTHFVLFQFSNDIQSEVSSHLDALELDSSVGASALPTDLAPANATEIYNQYDFSHKHDNKLPIINYKEQVLLDILVL